MERPRCKLCSRTFANGRALGGHMKAHLAMLPLPLPHSRHLTMGSPSSAASASYSPEGENEEDDALIYGQRGRNPRRSLKFSDPPLATGSARRPPKRPRKEQSEEGEDDDDDVSIAMCLVMLSRDDRTDVKRHRCKVCNKSFRSSQALGGHRVTHRKALNTAEDEKEGAEKFIYGESSEKIFECPYCFKVFASGQALGGHKRSHMNGSGNAPPPPVVSSGKAHNNNRKKSSFIDLNLPAPHEEEDDRSVVSDGEIMELPPQN
ncbi:hypothetical protein SAY87_029478 [Trapa incisa]|uniref:C2H2-type domain-containing protein n=1 Tax=Trapa incisa TaxID=236973 RepID=A0AAN7KB46_9MYRT|nr:hypothetical protein SAY87_029478 [Trapa incisa]